MSEHHLDCELNFSRAGSGFRQCSRDRIGRAVSLKDVRVRRRSWWSEIGTIQYVEDLRPELNVESLRDAPDVVILKD